MKNIKMSTVMLCNLCCCIAVLFLAIYGISIGKTKYAKIEIEVLPITYQSQPEVITVESMEESAEEKAEREIREKLNEIDTVEDKKEWFIEYKKIMDEYADIFYGSETIYDYYSDEEIYLVQRVVETECYGGDFDSKCNVASVIFNRIDNEKFGNDLENVITEPNQFAYCRTNISEDTVLAVEYAFAVEDTTDGCIAFHSNEQRNKFNGWIYSFTDNIGHHFYK